MLDCHYNQLAVQAGHAGKSSFMFAITKKGLLYKLRFHKGGMSSEKKIDLRVCAVCTLILAERLPRR